MKLLFVHREFPGQFFNVAAAAAGDPDNQVVFLSMPSEKSIPGVDQVFYSLDVAAHEATCPVAPFARAMRRADAVRDACEGLARRGFVPDAILGHIGWGETLPLRAVFPRARLVGYSEWFHGHPILPGDEGPAWEGLCRAQNAAPLLALADCDAAVAPTRWQRSRAPAAFHDRIEVLHDGVDTGFFRPGDGAGLVVGQLDLSGASQVVTYAARGLEPIRGFPEMMRAAAIVLERRPDAHVVVAGWDQTFYGDALPDGETHRRRLLAEVELDERRLHFVGPLSYLDLRRLYQASSAHVYLTRPFVLSWSVLEAMACGALVIGSDTPPVREVIRDGENGLLADLDDPRSIAERILQALSDPGALVAVRDQARRTVVEGYDLESLLPRWLSLLTAD